VRRFEGTRLHPVIDAKSVRRFKASDVERLAKELNTEQRSPRNAQQAVMRAAEMSKGELAALAWIFTPADLVTPRALRRAQRVAS